MAACHHAPAFGTGQINWGSWGLPVLQSCQLHDQSSRGSTRATYQPHQASPAQPGTWHADSRNEPPSWQAAGYTCHAWCGVRSLPWRRASRRGTGRRSRRCATCATRGALRGCSSSCTSSRPPTRALRIRCGAVWGNRPCLGNRDSPAYSQHTRPRPPLGR
jgi:hypothetical protein